MHIAEVLRQVPTPPTTNYYAKQYSSPAFKISKDKSYIPPQPHSQKGEYSRLTRPLTGCPKISKHGLAKTTCFSSKV